MLQGLEGGRGWRGAQQTGNKLFFLGARQQHSNRGRKWKRMVSSVFLCVFCFLVTKLDLSGKRESQLEELYPSDCTLGKPAGPLID